MLVMSSVLLTLVRFVSMECLAVTEFLFSTLVSLMNV
jgi:hypothetical protein